jgi:hypothetical protein
MHPERSNQPPQGRVVGAHLQALAGQSRDQAVVELGDVIPRIRLPETVNPLRASVGLISEPVHVQEAVERGQHGLANLGLLPAAQGFVGRHRREEGRGRSLRFGRGRACAFLPVGRCELLAGLLQHGLKPRIGLGPALVGQPPVFGLQALVVGFPPDDGLEVSRDAATVLEHPGFGA